MHREPALPARSAVLLLGTGWGLGKGPAQEVPHGTRPRTGLLHLPAAVGPGPPACWIPASLYQS